MSTGQSPVIPSVAAVPVEVPEARLQRLAKVASERIDQLNAEHAADIKREGAELDCGTPEDEDEVDDELLVPGGREIEDFDGRLVETRFTPAELVHHDARVRADDASMVAGLCHWVQGLGDARSEDHRTFHFGFTCPYEAMAAVLRGEPDPRSAGEVQAEDECPRATCQRIAATASEVYCDITGGALSYPTYDARTILTRASEEVQDLIDEECVRVRAEERQRIADLILPHHWKTSQVWGGVRREACGRCSYGDGVRWLWPCPTRQALTGESAPESDSAVFAAGSAVPVATPPDDNGFELCEHGVIGAHTYGEDMEDQVAWRDCPGKHRPLATPEPRCEHGKTAPHPVDPTMEQIFWHEHPLCPGPVATPTEPAAPKNLLTALQDSIDRARGRGVSITVDAIQTGVAEQDGQR